MKTLTLSLSDAAASDILDQMDWYEQEADIRLGSRWERSVYLSLCLDSPVFTLGTVMQF